ncbi:putative Ig domain-containing protein [uncultured Cedecea sp.]|uniref:putative Ig domain-containing protein n=1 Tax=uncultured Cedecea sp. TaxID=988762 RepID=UPI002624AA91|nr:putative Ig domain-containing protein [uncultured Cedecea sp.]
MSYSRSKTGAERRSVLQAWALEPRMMFDAAAVATAEQVIDATDWNPGVIATGVRTTLTISEGSSPQSVDLFSGVKVISAGDKEELTELVIKVSTSGSNQALVIDGSTIALQTGTSETADNGYAYNVSVSGGVTTLTLSIASSEAYSPDDVAKLIDSVAWKALDTTVESGSVTVTLVSLSDVLDTTDIGISATIDIDSKINVAPVVSDGHALESGDTISLPGIGSQGQVSYSTDGNYVYVAGKGNISLFTVDEGGNLSLVKTLAVEGMGTVTELVTAPSGQGVYAIDGGENIYMFSLDSNNDLALSHTYNSSNGDISGGLALSDDGAYLYVGTHWNDVAIFTRNTTTGELNYLDRAPGSSGSGDRNGVIISRGDRVYVIYTTGDHSIYAYQRQEDGRLTTIASLIVDGFGYQSVDFSLAVSADGQYLYVANPDENTLGVYQLSGTTLTKVESRPFEGIGSIALSADGKSLFVSDHNGTLHTYAVAATGGLTAVNTLTDINGKDIAVSKDGLSVLITKDKGITRYTLAQTMTQGSSVNFAQGMTLSDSNNDVLNNGEGNYLGSQITVSADTNSGTFGFINANHLSYSNGVISLDNQPVATVLTNGEGKVIITFTSNTSKNIANQVLQQLTYSNTTAAAGSFIQLSTTVSDGELTSQALVTTLRVNTVPQVNTDAATGYNLDKAISETGYNFTLFSGLFGDEDGDHLTWSVTGLPEGIIFEPNTRTLSGQALETGIFTLTITVTDASGGSASIERSLEVVQIDNRAPVVNESVSSQLSNATVGSVYSTTLDSNLFTDPDSLYGDSLSWTVSGLPEGFVFDTQTLTLSGISTVAQDYTVTVTVTDESNVSTSRDVTLWVITVEEANNQAPNLSADMSALTYTSDGKLSGFNQYVNSITLSKDGTLLIVAANTGSNVNGPNGTGTLFVYSRDTKTGELTQIQAFTQGTANDGDDSNGIEVNGLRGVTSVTTSADGSLLYVTGYNDSGSTTAYSISVFSIGESGGLSFIGTVTDIPEKVLDLKVSEQGNMLYALSATTLYSYQTGDNGALTANDKYQPATGLGTAIEMEVDAKGTVYIVGGSRVSIYQPDANGQLTYAGQIIRSGTTITWTDVSGTSETLVTNINSNAMNGVNGIEVSDTGYIYLTTGNGFLTTLHYDATRQNAQYVNASDAYTVLNQYPNTLVLSSDGSTLFMSGAGTTRLAIYKIDASGVPQFSETITVADGMSRFVVSADGKSIYGGRHLFFGSMALSMASAGSVNVDYIEQDTINVTQAIRLNDAEYDALNSGKGNYNGAVLTLERTTGGQSVDTFGFTNGDGLLLDNGVLTLNGKEIATFVTTEGKLVLTYIAEVDTATANQVLQRLTYTNTSDLPGSKISLTLSVADKYASSTVDLLLNVTEINNPPSLEAEGKDVTYVSGGEPVKLFDKATLSAGETEQTISEITLTVDNLQDGDREILVIGGAYTVLTDGATGSGGVEFQVLGEDGTVETLYYSVNTRVSVVDGVATVTIISNEIPSEALATLVQGISYRNGATDYSETPTAGTRVVTITSVKDNGGVAHNGIDTTVVSVRSEVDVGFTNKAPTVIAGDNQSQFTEKGDGAVLFKDVVVSTGESGQAVTAISLTVTDIQDGSSETLYIDGTTIVLTDGNSDVTQQGLHYSVAVVDGVATVELYSSDGLSTQATAQMLSEIAYINTSNDPTEGSRTVTLTAIQDNGGTADGGQDRAELSLQATVKVVGVNDAPVISGSGISSHYTVSGNQTELFADLAISAVEKNQTLSSVTFNIAGVKDGGSEHLIVDGVGIALISGSGTTPGGHAYTVIVEDGVATLNVSFKEGLTGAQTATLIEQSRYSNSMDVKTAGLRTILASVQDNGGGDDTRQLAATAKVTIVDNSAPVLGAGVENNHLVGIESIGDIPGIGDVVTGALSQDGKTLYVAGSDGNMAVFQRQTTEGKWVYQQTVEVSSGAIESVEVSQDGSHVLVLADSGNSLTILSATDALTKVSTLATQNVSDFAVSADGKIVYVVDGNYSGLKVYTQDSASGVYDQTQQISGATGTAPYLFTAVEIKTVGDYVYVLTDPASDTVANTLIVYQIQDDGSLKDVAYIRDGQGAASISDDASLTVSADGKQIVVSTASSISLYRFDPATNELNIASQQNGLSQLASVALSEDGKTFYITQSTGSISRYLVESDGTLTLKQMTDSSQVSELKDAGLIISGKDGSLIVFGENSIVSLSDQLVDSITLEYTEGETLPLTGVITLNDAEYDSLNNGLGNYQGATLTLGRENANADDLFGLTEANGLSLENGKVLHGGKAIADFVSSQGTLTLVFTSSVSTDLANQLLQQITYTHASADPGNAIALILKVTDSYGASDSVTLSLMVTPINDAPTLTTTAVNGTFIEGGAPADLFKDSQTSTIEAGQTFIKTALTVSGVIDGADEKLTLDGTEIALIASSGKTVNGYDYQVTVQGDIVTVTVGSSEGLPLASLVDGLTYSHDSNDPTAGTRTVTLTHIQDNGGTELGGQDSSVLNLASTVMVQAVNNPPVVTGTGHDMQFTEGNAPLALYTDTSVDTVEAGQTIRSISVMVEGVKDGSSEQLYLDGTTISLINGSGTTSSGYAWTVSVVDDNALVTLSSANGISAPATVIEGISYSHISTNPGEGVRNFTLSSVQDSGGGEDSSQPGLKTSVSVIAVNSPPEASVDSLTLLGATQDSNYTFIFPEALFNDVEDKTLSWQIDGLPEGLSFDPTTYTLSGTPATEGSFTLTLTATDAQGASASIVLTLEVEARSVTHVDFIATAGLFPTSTGGTDNLYASLSASLGLNVTSSEPTDLSRETHLATGELDLVASPWSLNPIQFGQLPALEKIDFKGLTTKAHSTSTIDYWEPATGNVQIHSLVGQGEFIDARLANGRPLPEWLQFDPAKGELKMDRTQAPQVGQIQLRLIRADGSVLLLTLREPLSLASSPSALLTDPVSQEVRATFEAALSAKDAISKTLAAGQGDSDALLKAALEMSASAAQPAQAS